MSEGYISNREVKQYRVYDQLKESFPSTFTGLSEQTEELRASYIRSLVTTDGEMNSTEILCNVIRKFGPLKGSKEQDATPRIVDIYQRKESTEEKIVSLINRNPEWDSDKIQTELKKD